jgi:Tfp pilus assembly protein PilX
VGYRLKGERLSGYNALTTKRERRGQEEIVGFVVIVVLVSLVLVVFLGISLRRPTQLPQDSVLVYQFLDSSFEQTSDCRLSEFGAPLSLDGLIKECFETGTTCFDGNVTCAVAERLLTAQLNASFPTGSRFPIQGYNLTTRYIADDETDTAGALASISVGECNNTYSGGSYAIPAYPGNIVTTLRLCT